MIAPQDTPANRPFELRLDALDVTLFDAIGAQSTRRDQRSLLACQCAVRAAVTPYVYLEIGSHLGGSLQPHVLDPACAVMHSIDPRPFDQPDQRGVRFAYPGNSTGRMLDHLEGLRPDARARVRCYEQSAPAIDPAAIAPAPQLCFIDGEHTDAAVRADFAFCRRVLAPEGLILFHDAGIVYNALAAIIDELDAEAVAYRAVALPDAVFAIEFGDRGLLESAALAAVQRDGYRGYLATLQSNDSYRQFFSRWPFPWLRRLRTLGSSSRG